MRCSISRSCFSETTSTRKPRSIGGTISQMKLNPNGQHGHGGPYNSAKCRPIFRTPKLQQVPRVIVPQPFCEGTRVFRYAAVLLLLLSWPAIAEVHPGYTFSQWEKLQDDERTAYIAGLIDSLETMAATEPAQRTARHYTECLMRS